MVGTRGTFKKLSTYKSTGFIHETMSFTTTILKFFPPRRHFCSTTDLSGHTGRFPMENVVVSPRQKIENR